MKGILRTDGKGDWWVEHKDFSGNSTTRISKEQSFGSYKAGDEVEFHLLPENWGLATLTATVENSPPTWNEIFIKWAKSQTHSGTIDGLQLFLETLYHPPKPIR